MRGVTFRERKSFSGDDLRDDIACFIGAVFPAVMPEVSPALVEWWRRYDWFERAAASTDSAGGKKKLCAGNWYLDDVPVPVGSWSEFLSIFHPGRPDLPAELAGAELPDTITFDADTPALRLFADGRELDLTLPADETGLPELAAYLEERLAAAGFPVTAVASEKHLVFRHRYPQRESFLSVARNDSLGFFDYASVRVWSLESSLPTAVRRFFREGGAFCYVVPVATPLPLSARPQQRLTMLASLVGGAGVSNIVCGSVDDFLDVAGAGGRIDVGAPRSDWHGVMHLLGLEDVAFVSFPDLPDLCRPETDRKQVRTPRPKEVFREHVPAAVASPSLAALGWAAPRLDEDTFLAWRTAVTELLRQVRVCGPYVQMVASAPLAEPSFGLFPEKLLEGFFGAASASFYNADTDLSFLHLVYPWFRTESNAPGGIEPPEGAFTGVLSRLARTVGTFRTAAGSSLIEGGYNFEPPLFQPPEFIDLSDSSSTATSSGAVGVFSDSALRVSCFGHTASGIRLLSDVTASSRRDVGQGGIRRLLSSVSRRCRTVGTRVVFEPNGQAVRQQAVRVVEGTLAEFFDRGAFRGKTADEAFSVRCSNDTMTMNDVDNGRIVTEVLLWPASAVERISVTLSLCGAVTGERP